MNIGVLQGNVSRVKKNEVNEERVAFNFGLAVDEGYGENQKSTFYDAVAFAKRGKQEEFYDKLIAVGERLVVIGKFIKGKPYTNKDGFEVTPWIFQCSNIDLGINCMILSGRLSDDAIITEKDDKVIARFTVAVDRVKEGADFIRCVRFGKGGFKGYAEKYLKKGKKIAIAGRNQTGSYTNKEGVKVYTQELIVSEMELLDRKSSNESEFGNFEPTDIDTTEFMDIPDDMLDEELPFN